MTPFLKQVAEHYYKTGGIENMCFIFPNRRSMVFFRKYLADTVASDPFAAPMTSPHLTTINDFFCSVGGTSVTDRVRLLLALYDCYSKLNQKAESLDDFIFWGDVILGDFNDVDKYLVDPKQLFTNVADYRAFQDTFEYLSETQKAAIKGFLSHFEVKDGKKKDVKESFLQIWNILYPLYKDYNEYLRSRDMAYEGMVYRGLASRLEETVLDDVFPGETRYVFVGLNALNECEKVLLRKLRDAGRAEFCWDWSGRMIRDEQNRSSFFMSDNVKEFKQAFTLDEEGLKDPKFNVISVPSSVGQAKRLPDIIRQIAESKTGGDMTKVGMLTENGVDCAVVLPDENLLRTVLNSIPAEIKDVNVTMGLPMSGSLFYAMMCDLASVQMHAVNRNGRWLFYHRQVWDLFSGEIFRKSADEKTLEIVAAVKTGAKYYIPQEDLNGTPLLDTVFRPVLKDLTVPSKEQVSLFAEYQKDVIRTIAPAIAENAVLGMELKYAKEFYRSINMLQEIGLEVLPSTYIRLLTQLVGAVSVPFRGEPLRGLQVMGPLETRALDFSNLIIMSANEGVFPHRSVSSSFVPPELRRAFGMPTYEYQDAVWAYYFYRMICRAENVWMLTDSRTEGLKSGEESRYIKQLEYHFEMPLKRQTVKFGSMKTAEVPDIIKTDEDVRKIKDTVLSATALQSYLACPAKFYYAVVKGLRAEEEVAESLDYGMFGTIYHDTMRALYTSDEAMDPDFVFDDRRADYGLAGPALRRISRDYIEGWLTRQDDIRRKVKSAIMGQLNTFEVNGRNLVVADVIVKYVVRTLECDLAIMQEKNKDFFEIIGREIKVNGEFCGQRFKGFIDRLDCFEDGQLRVVDYKTGKVLEDDEDINDGNAEDIALRIFNPDMDNWPKIALQFHIYDMLVQMMPEAEGKEIHNCIYSTANIFKDIPVTRPMNKKFYDAVSTHLEGLLATMYDTSVPFCRSGDEKTCGFCDFRNICGR